MDEAGGCGGVFAVHFPVCVCVSVWFPVCENLCVRKTCLEKVDDVQI